MQSPHFSIFLFRTETHACHSSVFMSTHTSNCSGPSKRGIYFMSYCPIPKRIWAFCHNIFSILGIILAVQPTAEAGFEAGAIGSRAANAHCFHVKRSLKLVIVQMSCPVIRASYTDLITITRDVILVPHFALHCHYRILNRSTLTLHEFVYIKRNSFIAVATYRPIRSICSWWPSTYETRKTDNYYLTV
jgi:hypothetical protein